MRISCLISGLLALTCLYGNAESFVKNSEERARIEAALPDQALVQPARPRKLLIFTLNVGYGGHPSMAHANEAFTLMGKKTGAFETVVTNDPAVFRRESLKQFDAVFFNNTVGNCFTNAEYRRNLVEFITGGGGLMGVHGTTVAFTQWPGAVEDWPEFGYMIGGRGANHKESDEHVWIRVEEPAHPITRVFGKDSFDFRDEFFRVHEPYSRDRLRVLLSIDTSRTDVDRGEPRGNTHRADGDYALAWIRNYGQGRVFYCTIAHNPYVFWDRDMLKFYLAAAQFALGDLRAPTTPSARLTPAMRAQEKLGWRIGIEAYTFHKYTFFEAIDKTRELGLAYIGGLSFQRLNGDSTKNFDPELSDAELAATRMKLEQAGLRLLTYYIQDLPADEQQCRKIFEFGRKMGIETFMSEPRLEALDTVEKLADEYGIKVGLHNHDQKASPNTWSPDAILKVCAGRSPRLGAAADLGYWMRGGIDPVEGIRKLKDRLITIQMHDLDKRDSEGQDVPWGTGAGGSAEFFAELNQPTMIGLEYSRDWLESMPKLERCSQFFNQTALNLAGGKD